MVDREKVGKSYEIKRWNLAEASLTPQPAESRNMASVKRYFDEMGRFIPYTREELARMDKKEYDAYMGMMFDKMNTMKNEGYDEEYADIDDMVELIGLVDDPTYSMNDFRGREMLFPKKWVTLTVLDPSYEVTIND